MRMFTGSRLILSFGVVVVALCLCANPAQAQDMTLNPTYGLVTLKWDFRPDPFVKKLVAGGPIYTDLGGVKAYVANEPDFKLYYTAGRFPLTIHVESKADTTLLINLPDGTWVANDDRNYPNDLNPLLHFANPQSGRYDIWVGTYNKEFADATLKITEYTTESNKFAQPAKKNHKSRQEIENEWRQALALEKEGKYGEAAAIYDKLLPSAEIIYGKDGADTATIVDNLGILYRVMGQYVRAEPFHERGLKIREAKLGKDHPYVAISLSNLAVLYGIMGQGAKAESLYRRCLQIREKLGKDHVDVASTLNSLALFYTGAGQYAKAEPLYRRSLQIYEAKFGPDHLDVATVVNNLGLLYRDMGQYAKAEPLYQRSLEIREVKLGPDHLDVATVVNNLGGLYWNMGHYAKAEPLLQRALHIRETKLGRDHTEVASSLNNLAILHQAVGQYAKVEPLLQRSLHIYEAKLGKGHPHLATPLGNLASFYSALGQYAKAEPLLQRSLNIREGKLGKDHPETAILKAALGGLYLRMEKYDLAETYCQDSIRIWESNQLSEHNRLGQVLVVLSKLYLSQRKYDRAQKALERSEKIFVDSLGSTHTSVAGILVEKTWIPSSAWDPERSAKKDADQSIALLHRAVEIYRARLGKDHPTTNHAVTRLACFLQQADNSTEAFRTMDRSLQALRKHTARVLPILSESEQLAFMVNSFEKDFHHAVSLSIHGKSSEENRLRAAGWVLNGKSVIQQSLAERQLLARDSQSSDAKRILGDLQDVRRQLARLNLQGPKSADETLFRKELDTLRNKETTLEARLHSAGLSHRQDPWIEIDELRSKLPKNTVYVDFLRFAPTDFSDLSSPNTKKHQPVYVAWISSRDQETAIVNLGPAEKIDAAIRDVRQEMQKAHGRIKQEGEIDAEKVIRDKLTAVSKMVLQPLLPQLTRYPQWILGPDGNLWLVPWASLPLDKEKYVIENHTLRYVTSGRDLALDVLQLDHKAGPAVIFADPDFDLDPSQILARTRTQTGVLRETVAGKKMKGQIEDWHVIFEFKTEGKLVIRDKDAPAAAAGEGSWKIEAKQLILQTGVARFEGTVQGNKIAGQRTRRNDDGTTSRDRWHVVMPEEEAVAALRDFSFRTLRNFGKAARLPGTAAEADAITPALTKLAGKPARYLDGDATVGAFQKLKSPKVLVMSTHGYFLPDQEVPQHAGGRFVENETPTAIPGLENPLLRSGLLLAGCNHAPKSGARQETGVLSGLEIVGTDLRGTELVVLSACETGLGAVHNGEGVAGLRQAFHLAGAQTVVASLWQIPDRETALLMKMYFEKMSAGQNKVDALRDAQLTMLRQRRDRNGAAHPFYWAAFTLTGR